MQYVTILLEASDGMEPHPVGEQLVSDPAVRPEAIHQFEALADGTLAMLTEVSGDLDRYRELLAEAPEVEQFTATGTTHGFAYSRIETTPFTEYLLDRREATNYVVEMPIIYTPDGGQRLTLVADRKTFAQVDPTSPDGIDVTVESIGEYEPTPRRRFAGLTERQREILGAAVSLGYYENPRETTQDEIAEAVGLAPGTVGEHLRKIESCVFADFSP